MQVITAPHCYSAEKDEYYESWSGLVQFYAACTFEELVHGISYSQKISTAYVSYKLPPPLTA